MKSTNPKALTTRLLVALALSAVSVAGLSGLAEAATCYTCHAPVGSTTDLRPVESTYRNITTGSIRGSHLKHIKVATTLVTACAACHGGAGGVTAYTTKHRNGILDVPIVGYSRNGFAQTGNPVPLGTCSTASCHVTSHGTTYVPTPTWGVTSGCVGCHTGAGAFTGTGQSPNTGSHTKHLAASATCGSCHTGAVAGTSGGNAHVDGNIDINAAAGYAASNIVKHAAGSSYSTCSTAGGAACHVSPFGTATITTTVWGVTDCAACHATVGAFTGAGISPTTGSHTKHQATGAVCGSCHANASAGVTGGSAHRDGNIDVTNVGYTANVTKHTAGSGYKTCSSASCHASPYGTASSPTPTWGTGGAGGCVSCHNGTGAFTASGGPGTGSHTKHMAKSATCGDCHDGVIANVNGGTAHGDTNIDVTGTSVSGYTVNVTKHTANVGYVGTCTTTCHASPYATSAGTTATWGSIGCVSCHNGAGALTSGGAPATGSHTKHTAAACGDCHTGAVAYISGGTAHPDTNIDVAGTLVSNYTANVAKHTINTGYNSTCTTSCHGNPYNTTAGTTPFWGSAGTGCGACHNGTGAFSGTGSSPNTGSHTKHMLANPAYTCGHCHEGAVSGLTGGIAHGDNNIDVIGGYTTNITKHAVGLNYKRCSSASCHADPFGTGYTTSPTWGVVASCGECHVGVGVFSGTGTSPTTGSHSKHRAITTCVMCHAGASAGISGGTAHIDGNIDVTGTSVSGYTANVTKHTVGSYGGTCSTTCHGSPYVTGLGTSLTWGVAGGGCGSCHFGEGAFSGTGSSPTTGSHSKHRAGGYLCASCHTGVSAGISGGTAHSDGNIDVVGGYATTNITKHTAGSGYTTCSNTCHGNPYGSANPTTPVWGTVSAAPCVACHNGQGAFTNGFNGPTTGGHTKHASVLCINCHAGASAGFSGGSAHSDGNIDVTGTSVTGYTANVTKHTPGTYVGTCTTTCHSNPYTAGAGSSGIWGSTAGGGCASCHNGVGAFTGTGSSPKSGSHTKHMGVTVNGAATLCASCHAGASSGVTGGPGHLDSNVDVIGGYGTGNITKHAFNTGYTNRCSTATCHADPFGTGYTTSPTWGVVATCGECHVGLGAFSGTGTSPTTGSHSRHRATTTCIMCHAGASAGISGGTAHIDGNIDVTGTSVSGYTANVTKHAVGSYSGTCSTTCHASPYVAGLGTSLTWGVAGGGCGTCHNGAGAFTATGAGSANKAPNTGSHAATTHANTACGICHAGASAGVSGGTAHIDGNIDVVGNTNIGYTANVTKHAIGTYPAGVTGSCGGGTGGYNNAGCHSAAAAPQWGNPASSGMTCIGCHTNAQDAGDGAPTRRPMSTEIGTFTWSHKKTPGVWNSADCCVCHMEGNPANGSTTALHKNNQLDFRDPDTGVTIKGVTFAGTPGAYSSTGIDAVAATFARNTGSNALEAFAQAVQVNLCLKCHDANGALSSLARVTGGTASKPYGAAGGTVLNVNAHFDTTNASYHPVKGKQNNSYANANTMSTPWNFTKTPGNTTSWGSLLTCWDCHDSSAAARTVGGANASTTAHGASATLRAAYDRTPAAATALCVICHNTSVYWTGTSATGSAFATSATTGDTETHPNTAGTTSRHVTSETFFNGCISCHSSAGGNTAQPARPRAAEDTHGFNTLAGGGNWATIAPATAGAPPFAFMRCTDALTSWRPKSWTGQAAPAEGSCNGSNMCARGEGTYAYQPGGVF